MFVFLLLSAGRAYSGSHLAEVAGGGGGDFVWSEEESGADEASEVEVLEVEYLLLALDFGEILFLLAGFGPLQAALLEVFEPRSDGGALHRPRRVSAVLWEPKEKKTSKIEAQTSILNASFIP